MNYFNTLPLRLQLEQLGKCGFMDPSEFDGVEKLKGKKIVIVGCGAQGLNQGLNLRDSGLDVSYALREAAIVEQRNQRGRVPGVVALAHRPNGLPGDFTIGVARELRQAAQ